MSSIAQEEARHTSENVKWNVKRRFENGMPIVNHKRFLGYTKDKKGGNLIIVPEEAETVRKVFELYINGWGPDKICRYMMKNGILTSAGKKKWINSTVTTILKNDKYTGDLIQQKSITVDYLTHKRVKNVDLVPKYHVEDNHPAIISKETFRLAQQVRAQKAETRIGKNKNLHKYAAKYLYSAFIICSECGRTLKRRYWNYGTNAQRVIHQCGRYIEGKANCKAKATAHDLIEGATIQMLNEVFIDNLDIVSTIKSIIKKNIIVTDEEKTIDGLLQKNEELQYMVSNLLDMKLKNKDLPESTYKQKYYELTEGDYFK